MDWGFTNDPAEVDGWCAYLIIGRIGLYIGRRPGKWPFIQVTR